MLPEVWMTHSLSQNSFYMPESNSLQDRNNDTVRNHTKNRRQSVQTTMQIPSECSPVYTTHCQKFKEIAVPVTNKSTKYKTCQWDALVPV